MAEDIAPELLEKIQEEFRKNCSQDKELQEISRKVADGTANCVDLENYAIAAGDMLAKALHNNVSGDILPDGKMYYNIASRILPPNLEECHEMVAEIAEGIYGILNEQAGLHIKALRPDLNRDRIDGIVDYVSNAELYEDVRKSTEQSIVNFSQSVATDAVHKNADFQYKAGLSPKIRRSAEGNCCKWCQSLEGTYDYADVRNTGNDVWRRHRDCRCEVTYDPSTGKVQNAHSKKWDWKEENKEKVVSRAIMSMDYPKIERGETKTIEIDGDAESKITSGKKVDFGDYQIVISDKLDIKPKELHEIEKDYIRPALEKIATDRSSLPTIVLADVTELSSAGRYVYDSNSLFLVLKRENSDENNKKYNTHLVMHELTHWKDCQEIAKNNPSTTEEELMPIYNEISKKLLDAAGVDKYNVTRYGSYAKTKYDEGSYYESYVEYRIYRMMGKWW